MEAWVQELRGSYASWHISMDMSRTCEDISRHVKDMKVHSQTIPQGDWQLLFELHCDGSCR